MDSIGRAEKRPVRTDGDGLSFEDSQMLLEFLILLDPQPSVSLEKEGGYFSMAHFFSQESRDIKG